MIYKFVKWDIPELDTMKDTLVYSLYRKLEAGIKPTREEKDWFFSEARGDTGIRLRGWLFSFRRWVNCYWVRDQYGQLSELYAFDKMSIRNNYGYKGNIKIVEVEVEAMI